MGEPYAWPVYQPIVFGQARPAVVDSLYQQNVWAHTRLLRDLTARGDHDAAIAIGRLLVERFPNDPQKLQLLAEALDHAERRDEALKVINAALAIAPTQAELYVTQGVIHVGHNAYGDARASYHRSIELDDLLAEAYFHRGHLSLREGNTAEAIADFEQAIACVPDPPAHYHADLQQARDSLRR